jgi:hypothetical protein
MPRSSQTIAALAAALAKAQAALANPAKTLVAALPAERGQPQRSFRYASLADGLEIVRSTLGGHGIAVVQSTAIDRDNGLVNLTTTLAHASGEWLASDWPVCALRDLPAPQRMGAALTYARRYGLFTLVGMAGEDDLDAPDLPPPTPAVQVSSPPLAPTVAKAHRNNRGAAVAATLDPVASNRQRDDLIAELESISSFEAAAEWAKRILPLKNMLISSDALAIEASLEARLAGVTEVADDLPTATPEAELPAAAQATNHPAPPAEPAPSATSDIAAPPPTMPVLSFENFAVTPKTRRRRDKRHRQFVAAQACVVCGRQPADAHHLRFAQPRGLGIKVSDEFRVPLCRSHHREVHQTRNEMQWWAQFGIKPLEIAYRLWTATHPVPDTTRQAVAGNASEATEPAT